MRIAIIGVGYVGLVTAACLAKVGHTVWGIDKDERKIAALKKGQVPIYEPDLAELIREGRQMKRLKFTTDLTQVIDRVDALFLAVGTPPKGDHSADLSAVLAASQEIGGLLKHPVVIVVKSTVPVGTCDLIQQTIAKHLTQSVDFDVASNPEFLREGSAVGDFMEPDRIVIGVNSPRAEAVLRDIYAPFIHRDIPLLVAPVRSSELIKYAANSFIAMKISFINEIANFCDAAGAMVEDITKGIGLDSRIGPKYLHAGIGYGGSCFPKDTKALIATGKSLGMTFSLLEAVEAINAKQHLRVMVKLKKHLPTLKDKTIAVWGLAFKANTDDTRESPGIKIITELIKAGAKVVAFDPVVHAIPLEVTYASSLYDCCGGADALVIATEWDQFSLANLNEIKRRLARPLVIDGRNIFRRDALEEHGFVYEGIGQ